MALLLVLSAAAAVAAILFVTREWTSRREAQLGSERFRAWFMRNYLGMNPVDPAKPSEPTASRSRNGRGHEAARAPERRRD